MPAVGLYAAPAAWPACAGAQAATDSEQEETSGRGPSLGTWLGPTARPQRGRREQDAWRRRNKGGTAGAAV